MKHGQFYFSMYFTFSAPVLNVKKGKWESTIRCKKCKHCQRIANRNQKAVEPKAKDWSEKHTCSSA